MLDHFDIISPIYDRLMGDAYPERLGRLLKLPASGWLLDAGGGTGRLSSHFLSSMGHLVVVDTSMGMLRQSRMNPGLCSVLSPVEELPFPDNSFERILVADAIHHFKDQRAAAGELIRVLKPGGRLVIEEPDINLFLIKIVALLEKLIRMQSCFLTPNRIVEIIREHGICANVRKTRNLRAWIIADKPDRA